MSPAIIRPIRVEDDAAVANVIRTVMPEFGAVGPGFAILDPEVDAMSAAYAQPRSRYFVAEMDGTIVGGGGVAPLAGGDPRTCELRKMYVLKEARGRGVGRTLLEACLRAAKELGFTCCYLETLKGMDSAQALYEQSGFQKLSGPMGSTGHYGCNRFYALDLALHR